MDEDERRETAIASASCLQPNFKSIGVTKAQLAKFQELHRRRLQIKERSKARRKAKEVIGRTDISREKELDLEKCAIDNPKTAIEDPSFPISESGKDEDLSSPMQQVAAQMAPKKRQKLYWGLDTKERWERKSNM